MRDYGKISCSLWNSQKFRALPEDDARYLYLYLHSCPHANSVGCFVLPEGYATTDLGWKPERYRKAIDSLCKAYLVAMDSVERLVRIIDFLEHDPFTNPKHAAGALKIALSLPKSMQLLNLLHDMRDMDHVDKSRIQEAIDSLSIAYRNPEPEPEPLRETKKVGSNEPTKESSPENESLGDESDGQGEGPILPDDIRQALAAYNAAAKIARVWPEVQKLTEARRKVLKCRIAEVGVDGWCDAMRRAAASEFLTGKRPGSQGPFTASFDWLVKSSNFTKLLEGNYDNRPGRGQPPDSAALRAIAVAAGSY